MESLLNSIKRHLRRVGALPNKHYILVTPETYTDLMSGPEIKSYLNTCVGYPVVSIYNCEVCVTRGIKNRWEIVEKVYGQ